jgi:Zn-dependent protease/predicted transcriptional regulator
MPSSLPLFRVAGIQIGIHSSWILAFLLISWSLAVGYFPQAVPGLGAGTYWAIGVVAALLLFASVVVHELAHSLVARQRGLKVDSITLFIFGGVSNLTREPATPGDEFAISVVGPLSSLILAGLFWLLMQVLPALSPAGAVVGYLAFTNLLLGAFNLIPGFPLDGGRIFRSIVWGATGSLRRGTQVASYTGQAFGWLLIIWGLTRVFTGDLIGGIWTAFIGWFLNNAAESTRQEQTLRESVGGVTAADLMDTPPVVVAPDLNVQDFVMEQVMRRGQRALPVVDASGRLVGIVSMTDARKLAHDAWPTTPVVQIMTPAPLITVAPADDVGAAIGLMGQKGLHQLPVVDDGRVVGLLNRDHVLRFIQMRHELGPATTAPGSSPAR